MLKRVIVFRHMEGDTPGRLAGLFAAAGVATLKADWTRRDPEITRALASFGRSGVPLYVLYPADPTAEPVLLPSLLTSGIVLDALAALPPAPDSPGVAAGAGT